MLIPPTPDRDGDARPGAPLRARLLLLAAAVAGLLVAAGPARANQDPIIDSLSASSHVVGPGGTVSLVAEAHDPDCPSTCTSGCGQVIRNDGVVSPRWSATGGTFLDIDPGDFASPYATSATWEAPMTLGTYQVTVYIRDNGGLWCSPRGSTTATIDIEVTDSPNAPPEIESLVADPVRLWVGESSDLTCTASDPDGDPLTYAWTAEGGTIVPGAPGTAIYTPDTPGAPAITCTVTDGGGAFDETFLRLAVVGAEAERFLDEGLVAPQRLTVDSEATVIAVDRAGGGLTAVHLASGELAWRVRVDDVRAAAADWNDDLLVGGPDGARVMDREGALVLELTPVESLGDVWAVAVDHANRRYGVLHRSAARVHVYDETGSRIAAFGETGDGPEQLLGPRGLAVTPAGDWVVADAGHFQLKVFDLAGNLLRTMGGSGGGAGLFTQLDDVAVDPAGIVYASDPFQDNVEAFAPDGTPRESLGTYGVGVGRFKTPSGLAVARDDDRLLVASTNSSTVQVFILDPDPPPVTELPVASVSPASLSFGFQQVGFPSPPLSVVLTSSGDAPLGLRHVSVSPFFTQTNDCGALVPTGASCTFLVRFTPQAPTPASGELLLDTSAAGEPLVVPLSGEGFLPPDVVFSQHLLDFEDTDVGTVSPPRSVTLTNPGTVPLDITSIDVTAEYMQTNDCGTTVAGGGSCTIDVTFAPLRVEDHIYGTLTVVSSAANSPHELPIDGRGVNPLISVADVSITEGDSGSTDAIFLLELSAPSPYEVRVDFATRAGTATEGTDYEAAAGTAVFAPGSVSQTVTVGVFGDTLLEPEEETFFLDLTNPVNASLESPGAQATIVDDERCPSPTLVVNGGAETPACEEELPGWTVASGVGWRTRLHEPEPQDGYLSFAAGLPASPGPAQLTQDIDVRVFATTLATGEQRFAFAGHVRTADEVLGDLARIVVEYRDAANLRVLDLFDSGAISSPWDWTLVEDERTAPPGTGWIRVRLIGQWNGAGGNDAYFDTLSLSTLRVPTVRVLDASRYEDATDPDALVFQLELACPYWQRVDGRAHTEDATAVAGVDYLTVNTAWTLPAGETLVEVPVTLLADEEREGHEWLRLLVTDVAPDEAVVLRAEAVGTISDDDVCPRSVGWWKTHREAWPVACLEIGHELVPEEGLAALLGYGGPDEGFKLARQLTAAKLNLANGAPPTVLEAIAEADAFLFEHPPGSPLTPEEKRDARRLTQAVHENSCDD